MDLVILLNIFNFLSPKDKEFCETIEDIVIVTEMYHTFYFSNVLVKYHSHNQISIKHTVIRSKAYIQ